MNLCAKTEYACLALLELAQRHSDGEPVQVRRIAERHGIPAAFLVQIFQELKRAGLVTSIRGAAGGYQLARSPEEITLAEVIDIVEGNSGEPTVGATKQSPLAPVLMDVCQELSEVRRHALEEISLANLLERAAMEAGPMWYI
jgi:Rrf2 family protein